MPFNRERFLEQLRGAIRNAIDDAQEAMQPRPARRPRPRPEPERQPERRRPEPRPERITEAEMKQIWLEERLKRPDKAYRAERNFIRRLFGFNQATKDAQLTAWREFIKFNRSGYQPFQRKDARHPFWTATGIPVRRFPWREWREMMARLGSP